MAKRLALPVGNEALDVRTGKSPATVRNQVRTREKASELLGMELDLSDLGETCNKLVREASVWGYDGKEMFPAFRVGGYDFSLEIVGTPRARERKGGYPTADIRLVLGGDYESIDFDEESPEAQKEILELVRRFKMKKGFFADGKTATFAAKFVTLFVHMPEAVDPGWYRGLVLQRLERAGFKAPGAKKEA